MRTRILLNVLYVTYFWRHQLLYIDLWYG